MGKMIVIHPDGSKVFSSLDKAPSLAQLRKAIGGGFIELVPNFSKYAGQPCVAFCDEEGKIKGLPENEEASRLWGEMQDYLAGPVVIVISDPATLRELGGV